MPIEPTVLNREVEGAVLVFENNLGKPGKRLRSSVDLAYNYLCLEGDDNLFCLNSGGRILWKYQIPGGIFDFKASVEGKYVAVSSNSGGMFYLENTGKLLWSFSLGRAIPSHEASPDGSIVVATTIPPSGKGHTLCILSKAGQVLRHLSIPYEIVTMGLSFDGSVILVGDLNQNVAQYSKTGDRQWIYSIRAPVQEIRVSQSGLLIFTLTSEVISISPSGTERWRIRLPEGPISLIKMSHDGSVNVATGSGTIFRYDLKGKILWKHPMPARKANFLLSYRSYNIVLLFQSGIEYWDKYGFAISTFHLPAAEHTSDDCFTVSQDGRYILYLDDLGTLRQVDVGKVLAQHLISASKIFMEELKRLGTVTPGAEENLQWAVESMNDGDVQYALSFGSQAYSSMESTLDSLPARRPAPASELAPAPAVAAAAPSLFETPAPARTAPEGRLANVTELYKKGLREIFSVKEEPSEIEWNLLGILREAFSISPEEHDAFEEEVKSGLKAAQPQPASRSQAPILAPPSRPATPGQVRPPPITPSRPVATSTSPPAYTPPARPSPAPSYVPRELAEPPAEASMPSSSSPTPEIQLDDDYRPSAPQEAPNPEDVETFTVEPEGEKEPAQSMPPAMPSAEPYRTSPIQRREPVQPVAAEAPRTERPEPSPQPSPASKPAETPANFSMDNYVSDILGKYLKK